MIHLTDYPTTPDSKYSKHELKYPEEY